MNEQENPYKDAKPQWFFNPSDKTRTLLTVMVLMISVPLGVGYMWLMAKWKRRTKIIATIVVLIYLSIVILSIVK